jgi:transcription elongation GreA/GreB family factor
VTEAERAVQTVASIERRVGDIEETINAIEGVPGKKSDYVAALDKVGGDLATLQQGLNDLWHRNVAQPVEAARSELRLKQQHRNDAKNAAAVQRAAIETKLRQHQKRFAALETLGQTSDESRVHLADQESSVATRLACLSS